MNNSKNKLAFVIGGFGKIGSSIVQKFLDKNIKVVVLDINIEKKKSNKIIAHRFDLRKIDQIEKNLLKCFKKYGCPNILVNTSYPITKRWSKINYTNLKLSELRKNVDIHLNSTAWCSIVSAREMQKQRIKGSIIFINSIYGALGQDKNLYKKTSININPVYSLIKSSLVGFSKNLASNYGEFGIRSNTIISGGIEGKIAGSKNKQNISFIKNYKSKNFIK